MKMLAVSFVLTVLLVQAKGDSYNSVGVCNNVTYDTTFDYFEVGPRLYVHSITDTPGVNELDGIVINLTKDPVENGVLLVLADFHTKDASIQSTSYKNVIIKNGVVQELIPDENGEDLEFYVLILGVVPECNAIVIYRCAFQGSKCSLRVLLLCEISRKHSSNQTSSVMLGDSILEEVQSIKFLVLLIDGKLNWNDNIPCISTEITSGTYVLRNLKLYCGTSILLSAYYGLVYHYLHSGILLWGNSSVRNMKSELFLQKEQ